MKNRSKKIIVKKVAQKTIKETLKETEETREVEEKDLKRESEKGTLDMLSKCVALATFTIAIMTTLASVLLYTFQRGELSYWRVSSSYIAMQKDYPLLDIAVNIFLAIVLVAVNMVIYGILASPKKKRGKKFLECAGMVFFSDVITGAFLFVDAFWELTVDVGVSVIIKKPGFMELIRETFLTILPAVVIGFSPGIMFWIGKRIVDFKKEKAKQKEEKEADNIQVNNIETKSGKEKEWFNKLNSALKIIVVAIFGYAVLALVVYCEGYYTAHSNTNFRIINDTQVILYEGEDLFVVSDCELITDENGKCTLYIDKKNKTEIKKSGVTTKEIRVEKAYRNRRQ